MLIEMFKFMPAKCLSMYILCALVAKSFKDTRVLAENQADVDVKQSREIDQLVSSSK